MNPTHPHMYEESIKVVEYPSGKKFIDEKRDYDGYGLEKEIYYAPGNKP